MFALIPYGTREDMPRQRLHIVTLTLVAINLIAFGYEAMVLATGGTSALQQFLVQFGVVPAQIIAHGPDLSLVTSMFLHGGILHLAGNMLFLLAFGDNVEDRLGRIKFLLLYLAWGLAGSLAHIWIDPTSTIPSVGASGAIAGVLGAYLLLFPRGVVKSLFFIVFFVTATQMPAALLIVGWFVLQLLNGVASLGAQTAQTGGVAFWAHIGGFAAGFMSALVVRRRY